MGRGRERQVIGLQQLILGATKSNCHLQVETLPRSSCLHAIGPDTPDSIFSVMGDGIFTFFDLSPRE